MARWLSDERLARRAIDGDRRAFAAIYRRYHQSLYRFCLAIVGDADDAQDALQNTMVKVMRALPGEKRRIELKPWLYRVAHNESVELLRRRRGTEQLDPDLAVQRPGLVEESVLRERLRRLISDLDELPERQRGALVMRELGGLDFDQIGAALGTSSAAARQTLYEARLSLRQMEAGREMSCDAVTRALSDADGRVMRRRDIRAHLRSCESCSRFRSEIAGRQRDLAALSPLPAVAAGGLLHGLLGGHGGSGGVAGVLGGVAKSLGASAVVKSAATATVIAAVGISAADYGGAIHIGLPADGGSQTSRTPPPAGISPSVARRAERDASRSGTPGARSTSRRSAPAAGATVSNPTKLQAGAAAIPTPEAEVEPNPAATSHGSSGIHHPASTHGQETAAAHKAADHGGGHAQSHPAGPAKPPHPTHPPASEPKGPPASPPGHDAASQAGSSAQSATPAEAKPSHRSS